MQTRKISILFAIIILLSLTLTAAAQQGSDTSITDLVAAANAGVLNLTGGDVVNISCDGRRLRISRDGFLDAILSCDPNPDQPTATQVPNEPTATQVPTEPTATQVPTEPTATPTQQPGGGDPPPVSGPEIGVNLDEYNQIRAEVAQGMYERPCTEAEHNPTEWHPLVNRQANCHYDHQHGDDPNFVNDIFGAPGAWFNPSGQSISYPWQTFKATSPLEPNDVFVANGQMENDLKHEGYGWVVRRNQDCPEPFCITDFRLQFHGIFGPMGAVTRYHSYSFEARVCENAGDLASCGIVRNGGWADFGRLFITDNNLNCGHDTNEIFVDIAADSLYFPIDRPEARDEIRCHPFLSNTPAYPSNVPLSEWWAHSPADRVRFQLRSFDPLSNISPDNPTQWQPFCDPADPACHYNQSIMTAWIGYILQIPEFLDGARLDADRNGRTDFLGYANRWGSRATDCSAPGLDCVPTEYNNVVLYQYPDNNGIPKEARYFHHICDNCQKVDHDVSPADQQWITWFHSHLH